MAECEYKIYGETEDKRKKKPYWEAAIGLQEVDDLRPSDYMIELAWANVDGDLSYRLVEELLYTHYEDIHLWKATPGQLQFLWSVI